MVKCPKCNNIVHDKTAFCSYCGFNRGLDYVVKICPKCGREYVGDTDFCSDDGNKLVDPEKLVPKCVKCNRAFDDSAKFCPKDGGEIIAEAYRIGTATPFFGIDSSVIGDITKKIGGDVTVTGVTYATFKERVLANLIDSAIMLVGVFVFALAFGDDGSIFSFIMGAAYSILFETSKYMGTPGKLALRLKVVDVNGNKLSVARAAARHFSKFISTIILGIGYLFPLFTPYKQTLHDLIAGCVVLEAK